MDSKSILSDDMTLDEKLAAIDAAMAAAAEQAREESSSRSTSAPFDPALLTICDGCE